MNAMDKFLQPYLKAALESKERQREANKAFRNVPDRDTTDDWKFQNEMDYEVARHRKAMLDMAIDEETGIPRSGEL